MMHIWVAALVLLPLTMSGAETSSQVTITRHWVEKWLREMPDFICQQSSQLSWAFSLHSTWHPDHSSIAEVTVISGIEHYQLVRVDSQPDLDRKAAEDLMKSRGEFVSAVRLLFDSQSDAAFHARGTHRLGERMLTRVDFSVPKTTSQWYIGTGAEYAPGYYGTLWVNPADGSIDRLEMEANRFPAHVSVTEASLRLSFAPVAIAGSIYIMPVDADVTACTKHAYCERRKITFSDYRHFVVRSRVVPK